MKFLILFTTLVLAGTTELAGPISVSDNNIGDIVNIDVDVQANVTTEIQSKIVKILLAKLTHIGDLDLEIHLPPKVEGGDSGEGVDSGENTEVPELNLLEAIDHVRTLTAEPGLTKEQKERIWKEQVEAMVQKVLGRKG